MMINAVELASRPVYRLFLQSLLVVVKSAPRAQTGVIIAAARAFLGATWALVLGAIVVAVIFARDYILRKLETQQATREWLLYLRTGLRLVSFGQTVFLSKLGSVKYLIQLRPSTRKRRR